MLESRRSTDIHELALEAPAEACLRARYERIVESYHRAEGWVSAMDADGRALEYEQDGRTTFYAALCRVRLWPAEAEAVLEDLCRSPDYKLPQQWWTDGNLVISETQLAGLLVRAAADPSAAMRLHRKLRGTRLFDRGLWRRDMRIRGAVMDLHTAEALLLEPLILRTYDAAAANDAWERLCGSDLRSENGHWTSYLGEEAHALRPLASIQLLATLTEAAFDPQTARKRYDALRHSSAYDSASGQWRILAEDGEPFDDIRSAKNQLLALLVEETLSRDVPTHAEEALPTILEME